MRLAVVFPGQGAQIPDLGRGLVRDHPVAREVYAEAQDALGYDLIRAGEDRFGELSDTAVVQPLLVAFGIAAWRALRAETGLSAVAMAGHSLGEITALACAGCLEPGAALRLAETRGRLMAQCPPGGMAVVFGLPADEVAEICEGVDGRVTVANRNLPDQCVISGDAAGVEAVTALLTAAKAVAKPTRCAARSCVTRARW